LGSPSRYQNRTPANDALSILFFHLNRGVIAGFSFPSVYTWVGIGMIIAGLLIEYQNVYKAIGKWKESEQRVTITYTGDTVTTPNNE